jgi:hypothetical protein
MTSLSRTEYEQRWRDAGWCVIEGVIPPDDLADAQRALPDLFPTADEFADNVDPERNAPFFTERGAPRVQFPFESGALNRVALHDATPSTGATRVVSREHTTGIPIERT